MGGKEKRNGVKAGPVIVHGWDLSLNHAGFVELQDGEPTWFRYVTDSASAAKVSTKHGVRLKVDFPRDVKDRQRFNACRLAWWERFIWSVLEERKPHYVGIEDYALDEARNAHDKGELGGLAKTILMVFDIPFRLHEPQSIKMFAVHNGQAGKNQMVRGAKDRWGVDFTAFNPPERPNTKKGQDTTVSEDLADALGIAKLVWTEVRIRAGDLLMSQLEHESEIRVFNRVTKAYPVNLLEREWIRRPREEG